jgi:predicted HicB family RNase H-like nuclease
VDLDAGVLRGKVVNTRDTITFQGKTVEEAMQAFRDSVDDYLEFCASSGDPPEKPFSGKFIVRVRPELHRDLSAIAQSSGMSLNKLVLSELLKLARRKGGDRQETVIVGRVPAESTPAKSVKVKKPSV